MLETLLIICLILWLLGVATSVGSLIHVLLIVALVLLVVRLARANPPIV